MYEMDGDKYYQYYIKGKIDNNYVYFVVDTDVNNETFDIFPINEENYKQYLEKVAQTNESKEKSIEKKTYNFYRSKAFTDEELCRKYYTNYIKLLLTYPDEAYKMLNEEYKKEKFASIESFKSFIQSKKNKYESIYKVETADSTSFKSHLDYDDFIQNNSKYQMKSFAVNRNDEYTQCICGNITGSNYIFNVVYPGEYEAFIDSYTIDTPVFTEKYNSSTDENKVALNLEKIRGAINTNDYRYVYQRLDETFRNNKFGSIDKLRDYIQKNFFEYNKFQYVEVRKEGNVYIGVLNISNALNESEYKNNFNIVMRLDENNQFVMSFSME